MNIRPILFPLAASIALFTLQACDRESSESSAPRVAQATPAQPDPVAELKRHLEKAQSSQKVTWSDLKYDVKKSDSLVSPYDGIITVDLIAKGASEAGLSYIVRLAYSDGKWRITNLQTGTPGFPPHTYTASDDEHQYYKAFCMEFGF